MSSFLSEHIKLRSNKIKQIMITKFVKMFRDKRFIIGERNCNTVYLSDKYKDLYALIRVNIYIYIYIYI